jgi:hypothetical protein
MLKRPENGRMELPDASQNCSVSDWSKRRGRRVPPSLTGQRPITRRSAINQQTEGKALDALSQVTIPEHVTISFEALASFQLIG